MPLTERRAKPAMHFGGQYRIIDFTLSNAINSGLRRNYVVTQYKSHSLLRHIQRAWSFLRAELGEFIDLLPAQQRVDEATWYRGTADAVWQNLDILRDEQPKLIVILAGDHVYKMDYSVMLQQHVERGADITVGCAEVPAEEASGFGVMAVDAAGRVVEFLEKPAQPPSIPGQPGTSLASMGIYVCSAEFLYDVLNQDAMNPDSTHDFGKDFLPKLVSWANVFAHRLSESCVMRDGAQPYWRDVGTLDAFWDANIDLTRIIPELDLYDARWPIFSAHSQLPPAKFVFDDDHRRGSAVDSVVSSGVVVSGASVRGSLLSLDVRLHSHAEVSDSVVLPGASVGRHARLHRTIVDHRVQIPEGLVVGDDATADAARFYRTAQGITLITQAMLDAL